MSALELYRIVSPGGRVWTMTSAARAQEFNSGSGLELYRPVTMGRSNAESKSALSKSNLSVRIPLTHELSTILLTSWQEEVTTMTIFSLDNGVSGVIWKGRLTTTKPGDANLELVFESIYTSMRRPGLRARFLRNCRHALYQRGCNLDMEDFAVAATLDAISGSTLTVPEASAQSAGYYTGGIVKLLDGSLLYISNHVGSALTLNRVSGSLLSAFAAGGPGMNLTIYPGCDHTFATCAAKFLNSLNYGGFDFIPNVNPFSGNSVV